MWQITTSRRARRCSPGAQANTPRAGEANLTDEDGPYIELMAGVYTDNQPDFSGCSRMKQTFSQFWYPVQRIPGRRKTPTAGPAASEPPRVDR